MDDSRFVRYFEKKVLDTVIKYKLAHKKEKMIVACSGGKDSTTVLYLLNKWGYKVEGLIIDLLMGEWSDQNLKNLVGFCKKEGIKLKVLNLRKEVGSSMCYIRAGVQARVKVTNCLVCGIIKKWLLNKKARELGGAKLVTGHNLDDAAETVMMNLLKNNLAMNVGMGPKAGVVKDRKFVSRIKPLYFMLNSEVRRYSALKGFPVVYEPCPCSANVFRRKVRKQLELLGREEPKIKENIVKAMLKILPEIERKHKAAGKIRYCSVCAEPSRGEVCRMCRLMGK